MAPDLAAGLSFPFGPEPFEVRMSSKTGSCPPMPCDRVGIDISVVRSDVINQGHGYREVQEPSRVAPAVRLGWPRAGFAMMAWIGLAGLAMGQDEPPPIPGSTPARPAAGNVSPPVPPSTATQPDEGAVDPNLPNLLKSPTTRFRFLERYQTGADEPSERIEAYRVAYWETTRTAIEVPQGAPRTEETSLLVKTTEQPASLGGLDGSVVLGLVRRYDSFQMRPDPRQKPSEPEPLTGRTFWILKNRRGFPEVILLGNVDRIMGEREFRYVAFQNPFQPDLADLLPELPITLGEVYRVEPAGTEALTGGRTVDGFLSGKLVRFESGAEPGMFHAVLAVAGRLQQERSAVAVNAQLTFEFEMPADGSNVGQGTPPLVAARGGLTKLVMTQVDRTQAAGDQKPANATRTRQLVLERRLELGGAEALQVPARPPVASMQNSWVRSIDPTERFTVDHPQDYLPGPLAANESGMHLMRDQPQGPDDLFFELKTGDRLQEEQFVQSLVDGWTSVGVRVDKGPASWLPEAEWPGRRVYRAELTLTPVVATEEFTNTGRFYAYLVQTGRDATFYLRAMTASPTPEKFRSEVEDILQSLTIGDAPAK